MPESLQEKLGRISQQFDRAFNVPGASWETAAFVAETYEKSLIAYEREKFYRVTYTDADLQATFAPRGEWTEVQSQRTWVETVKSLQAEYKVGARHSRTDQEMVQTVHDHAVSLGAVCPPPDADAEKALVYFGGEIKALGDGKVGGVLVRFTSEKSTDLTGDFFDAQTDFGDASQSDTYYHHGLDMKIGKRVLGKGALRKDDVGVWIEAQLNLRDEYEKAVYGLAEAGKLGWSSGTAAHLVEREPVGKAYRIKRWPLGLDASLTPTPAEPRNAAQSLKSYVAQIAPALAGQPAPDGAQANKRSEIVPVPQPTQEHTNMPDETQSNELEALKGQVTGLGAKLDQVLKAMEEAPRVRNSGYFSQDGGRADQNVKSFGDFLISIKRGDAQRLHEVYGSVKDMSSETGAAGGYLVPTEHHTALMQIAGEQSYLLGPNGVFQQPVTAPAGTYPALDQFTAPTAGVGNTAAAGKLTTAKRAQGGAYTETQPEFEQVKYLVNDAASGMVQAPKELRADSPIAIETLLKGLISIAVKSKLEYYILRGNGVGEPLGILNAPAAIGIAADVANTWDLDDAVEIVSRHKNVSGKPSVWAIHPGTIVDISAMGVSSVNGFIADPTMALRQSLLGYGLVKSEHLPQPDTSGHAILLDPGAYVLFTLGNLYIDFSEHFAFGTGLDSWRFGLRCDGQPWWKGTQTLADPTGSFTVSPFVYNSD